MRRYIIILYTAVLFALSSCVYTYEASVDSEEGRLVVEGDIVAGGVSTFTVSETVGLESGVSTKSATCSIWIEDSEGRTYGSKTDVKSSFSIDTPYEEGLQYRLWVVERTGQRRTFCTEFAEAYESPELSNLRVDVGDSQVVVRFDAALNPASPYIRWNFTERWEYHADYNAEIYYYQAVTASGSKVDAYGEYDSDCPTYWCWNSDEGVARSGSADGMESLELKGGALRTIPRTSKKVQTLYWTGMEARTVSKEAYDYFSAVDEASSSTGDFFSPTPNAIMGNIRCADGSPEALVGYVSVVRPSTSLSKFFQNSQYMMYNASAPNDEVNLFDPTSAEEADLSLFEHYNYLGNRPVLYVDGKAMWAPRRCIDCTSELGGGTSFGTKNKPADWPDDNI